MSLTVARWVFQPPHARSLEENERWWRECYVPSTTDAVIQSQPHWRIIVGGPGCGKSIALDALERQWREHALVLRYPPEYWPHGRRVLKKGGNHLSQLMALAGFTIRHTPTIALDRIIPLPRFQREFLRWLMDKFGRPRTYLRWIQSLGGSDDDALVSVPYEDLYPTETEFLDVQGQIEELIVLVRRWGFTRILVLIDTGLLTVEQETELGHLFDWLELMHHDGLAVITAVTPDALERGNLVQRARGRASVVPLNWSRDQVRVLADRHIAVATDQQMQSLEQVVNPDLLQRLETMLAAEYGGPTPQGWIALAELLLNLASQSGMPLHQTGDEIKRAFYARFIPLRLDPHHRGIWRGPKFIPLDKQPFRLLEILAQHKGKPMLSEDLNKDVAGSLSNVHTLVRRFREAIEPDPSVPIYLKNRQDEGYWLENLVQDLSV
jgi:hypothetical protein